ncbi:hypothetical protein KEM52_002059, partial [Ascosphaera acerosa]
MLPGEMRKWRSRQSPEVDVFDYLGLNPLDQYKVGGWSGLSYYWGYEVDADSTLPLLPPQNFSIMAEYVTDMGRIKHSSVTGLRPVNQRKIAKAIRRAIGLGLMPTTHKHPEILLQQMHAMERDFTVLD